MSSPESPVKGKRSFFRRHPWVLAIVLGVICLFVVAGLVVRYYISENYIRNQVLPKVASVLGVRCEPLSISVGWDDGIVFSDVTLFPVKANLRFPQATIKKLRLDLDWPATARKRPHVRSIDTVGFTGEPWPIADTIFQSLEEHSATGPGNTRIDGWSLRDSDLVYRPSDGPNGIRIDVNRAVGTVSDLTTGTIIDFTSDWHVHSVSLLDGEKESPLLGQGTFTEQGRLDRSTKRYDMEMKLQHGRELDLAGTISRQSGPEPTIDVAVGNGGVRLDGKGIGSFLPQVQGKAVISAGGQKKGDAWTMHTTGAIADPRIDIPFLSISSWGLSDLEFETDVRWSKTDSPTGAFTARCTADPTQAVGLPKCSLVVEAIGAPQDFEWSLRAQDLLPDGPSATASGRYRKDDPSRNLFGEFVVEGELSRLRPFIQRFLPSPVFGGVARIEGTFVRNSESLEVSWSFRSDESTIGISEESTVRLSDNSFSGKTVFQGDEFRSMTLEGRSAVANVRLGTDSLKPVDDVRFSMSAGANAETGDFEVTDAEIWSPIGRVSFDKITASDVRFSVEGKIESIMALWEAIPMPNVEGDFRLNGEALRGENGTLIKSEAESDNFRLKTRGDSLRLAGPIKVIYNGPFPPNPDSTIRFQGEPLEFEHRSGDTTNLFNGVDLIADLGIPSKKNADDLVYSSLLISATSASFVRKTPQDEIRIYGPLHVDYDGSIPGRNDWTLGIDGSPLRFEQTTQSKTVVCDSTSLTAEVTGPTDGKNIQIREARFDGPCLDVDLDGTYSENSGNPYWDFHTEGECLLENLFTGSSFDSRPKGAVRFTGDVSSVDGRKRGRFSIESPEIVFPKSATSTRDHESAWPAPDWDLDLDLKVDKIDFNDIESTDHRWNVSLRDGKADVASYKFIVGKGIVSGTAEIDLAVPDFEYAGTTTIDNSDLGAWLEFLPADQPRSVTGTLSGKVAWHGSGKEKDSILSNVEIETADGLFLRDGRFKRNKTAGVISKILQLETYNDLCILDATGSASLRQRTVFIDDIFAQTDQGEIAVRGRIDLDGTQDLVIDVYVPLTMANRLPSLSALIKGEGKDTETKPEGENGKTVIGETISKVGEAVTSVKESIPYYDKVRKSIPDRVKVTMTAKGTIADPKVGGPKIPGSDGIDQAVDFVTDGVKSILK